jgi:hypothetical protein
MPMPLKMQCCSSRWASNAQLSRLPVILTVLQEWKRTCGICYTRDFCLFDVLVDTSFSWPVLFSCKTVPGDFGDPPMLKLVACPLY